MFINRKCFSFILPALLVVSVSSGTLVAETKSCSAPAASCSGSEKTAASCSVTDDTPCQIDMKFGTSVEAKEIQGEAESFTENTPSIYCWTKITCAQAPCEIKHVWYKNSTKMFEKSLSIKSSPFRTWSNKILPTDPVGDWTVEVVDAGGKVLKKGIFNIVK